MGPVTVIDIGTSNVGSVANMLRKLGVDASLTTTPEPVASADRLVLPGVGSFDVAMQRLDESGLSDALTTAVNDRGVPILGICLGLQLFAEGSEEGERPGLGWIGGRVRRLPSEGPDGPLRIPHMGWNRIAAKKDTTLDDALVEDARFYFVHTYAIDPSDPTDALFATTYGSQFISGVQRDNITGVQFHPEKSHRHGKALLGAWLET